MACGVTDPVACISDAINSMGNALGGNIIENLAINFNDAAEWALVNMTSAWMSLPAADISSAASPAAWINEHTRYLVLFTMTISIFIACARLVLSGRFEHLSELAKGLGWVIVASTAGTFIITLGIEMGDIFSDWILGQVNFQANQTLGLMAIGQPALVFVIAILVILVQLVQLMLMIVRNAMLILLAGMLPLTAAAMNTATGKQWFQKACAWGLAFLLYKPVAAILYAASIMSMSTVQNIGTQLSGVFMMFLAVAALPALMRFMVPATAAMSGGNAGAIAGSVAGAAVATGAIVVSGGAAAGAGAGASGFGAAGGGAGSGAAGAAGTGGGASTAGGTATGGPSGTGASGGGSVATGGSGGGTEGAGGAGVGPSGAQSGGTRVGSSGSQPTGGQDSAPSSAGDQASPSGASQVSQGGAESSSQAPAASGHQGGEMSKFNDLVRAMDSGAQSASSADDAASGMVGE